MRKNTPISAIAEYVESIENQLDDLLQENEGLAAKLQAATVPAWQTKADTVIAIAKALDALAIPYVFGGETIKGMDCSGFTQFLFRQVGYNLPRVSHDQASIGEDVNYADLRAGDLIFYDFDGDGKITHVSICMGGGQMIHTNTPATGINVQSTYWNFKSIVKIKRVIK